MAGTKKRQRSKLDTPGNSLNSIAADRALALAADVPFDQNGHGTPDIVVYVLGGGSTGPSRNPAQRDFPLVTRKKGESDAAHLARIVRQVDEAIAAGGTHLLVPREHLDWLGDNSHIAEYLAEHH